MIFARKEKAGWGEKTRAIFKDVASLLDVCEAEGERGSNSCHMRMGYAFLAL